MLNIIATVILAFNLGLVVYAGFRSFDASKRGEVATSTTVMLVALAFFAIVTWAVWA